MKFLIIIKPLLIIIIFIFYTHLIIILFIFYVYIYRVCNCKICRNVNFLFLKIVKKKITLEFVFFLNQNNNKFKIMEYKRK